MPLGYFKETFAMIDVEEQIHVSNEFVPKKLFFQVFLSFKKPDESVSIFIETMPTGCGIYHKLAEIFNRLPREMYECICSLAEGKSEAFMQEYLSLNDASQAVVQASLFAHTSDYFCFRKQEGFFHIKEVKK